jgi:hypothetical protein
MVLDPVPAPDPHSYYLSKVKEISEKQHFVRFYYLLIINLYNIFKPITTKGPGKIGINNSGLRNQGSRSERNDYGSATLVGNEKYQCPTF